MIKVFISHATQDNVIAETVYERLTDVGIRCWLDNVDISPEVDWLKQVEAAVKESSHGLFLLSSASVNSPAAMGAFHDLLLQEKPMYVALIGNVVADELPYYLQNVPYFDLTEDFDLGLGGLIDVIQRDGETERNGGGDVEDPESRDITITLQANLRDLDTDKFIDLITRLMDVGIKDIKVINVSAG